MRCESDISFRTLHTSFSSWLFCFSLSPSPSETVNIFFLGFLGYLPDYLIEDMNDNLRMSSGSRGSNHTSRYYRYEEQKLERLGGSTGNMMRTGSSSSSIHQAGSRNQSRSPTNPHREYLYNKYGKFGGTWSPRMPKRSTAEEGWYKSMSKEMGHPRSPTPILKRRNYQNYNNNNYNSSFLSVHEQRERSTSPIGRPLSVLSRSSAGSRAQSPYSSRAASPTGRQRSMSPYRTSSPKFDKSVIIGPVTDMVTKRELERHGQQEYYRGRDATTGKVSRESFSIRSSLTLPSFLMMQ